MQKNICKSVVDNTTLKRIFENELFNFGAGRRSKLVGINNSDDVSMPVFTGSTNNNE